MVDPAALPRTPAFVLEYDAFLNNLGLIRGIQDRSPCSFLFALKGFAMHRVFPELASAVRGATASSLFELRLADEFFNEVHAYAPVYIPGDFPEIARRSTHVTFNSLTEYERYRRDLSGASPGLRINPEYSTVETDLYNPCIPGSRLGVQAADVKQLPAGIQGLHSHNLCESSAGDLSATLDQIECLYGHLLEEITWINLGGGHLVTRKGYDIALFERRIAAFHEAYPHLDIILEPGAAYVWETGVLIAEVLDIVNSSGIRIAMLDTSFAAHMPDCLEMPYTPRIRGAHSADTIGGDEESGIRYRMGGATCLAGDVAGDYLFPRELKVGDRIVFEDMMHYTMVKTNMFNGIALPEIGIWRENQGYELAASFSYHDYRGRLS